MVLGQQQLVAVPYPQQLYIVEMWTLPSQVDMGTIQGGSSQEAPAQPSGSKSTATPTTLPQVTSHLVSNSPSTFPPPPNMMTRSMVSQLMPRKQLKRTPLPEEITQSSSLPVTSTSDIPHSKPLTICLPCKASTSALFMSAEGMCSATATPPPHPHKSHLNLKVKSGLPQTIGNQYSGSGQVLGQDRCWLP